jgi:hypothetical protein
VARTAFDEQFSGPDTVLPVVSPVTPGDGLVVTLVMPSPCPGAVTATDTQGDRFYPIWDSAIPGATGDRERRTVMLAAVSSSPLTTADSIRITQPDESYLIEVDEFRGLNAGSAVPLARTASGSGGPGGHEFTTPSFTCKAGELMIGLVQTNDSTDPQFTIGWTALPLLTNPLLPDRLAMAYQVAPATGPCAATGLTNARWTATLVDFP